MKPLTAKTKIDIYTKMVKTTDKMIDNIHTHTHKKNVRK